MAQHNSFLAPLLFASLVSFAGTSWAHGSQAETWDKQSKFYQAGVGNHGMIKVETDENWVLVASLEGDQKTVYRLDWKSSQIDIFVGEDKQSLAPGDQDYADTLTLMRDLTAYTTVPQRYTWDASGVEALNLPLSETTAKLDGLLHKFKGFSPNCVVYSQNSGIRLELSVGTYTDLGSLSEQIGGAWVRGGYELVLAPAPNFGWNGGEASVIGDTEGQDASFDLRGKTAGAIACRPAIY